MRPSHRNFLINLLLLFIVLAISYAALEFTIYKLGLANSLNNWRQADDTFHHSLRPNSEGMYVFPGDFTMLYKINSLGFRDEAAREVDYSTKEKEEFRIVFIGDSFTEGFGLNYSDTFSALVGIRLKQERPETKWTVINGGVASYSPLFENVYIKKKIIPLKPDLVILNLDLGDFFDDYKWSQPGLAEFDAKGLPVRIYPPKPTPIATFFRKHSYTYNFLAKHSILSDPFKRKEAERNALVKANLGDVKYDIFALIRSDDAPKKNAEVIARTKFYLQDIHKELSKNNISFLLVMYPNGAQISTKEWRIGRLQYFLEPDKIYSPKIFEEMGDFSKENGINFLSTYYAFKNSTAYPLFYTYDNHFTKNGSRVITNAIYERLIKENFYR